jgi:hypothetical protein
MKKVLLLVLAGQTLASCGDECSSYSKHTCAEIESANYNVYFYFPNGEEKALGSASGLQQCSAIAGDYAISTGAPKNWICCMATANSSCEEKHR